MGGLAAGVWSRCKRYTLASVAADTVAAMAGSSQLVVSFIVFVESWSVDFVILSDAYEA